MNRTRILLGAFGLLLTIMPCIAGFTRAEDRPEVYDLDRCIRQALETNRDILVEREEEVKAGHRIREAWAGAFPQLGFEGTYNKNIKRPSFFFNADGGFGGEENGDGGGGEEGGGGSEVVKIEIGGRYDYMGTFSLTQPIWLAGKVGAALKAAKIYDKATNRTVQAMEHGVVLQTKVAFYDALLAQAQVEVFQSTLDLAEQSLETTVLRRDRGLASDFEVLRAEVEVSESVPLLIAAENASRQNLNDLKLVMGIDVQAPIEIRGGYDYVSIPEEKLASWREKAVENRPDRQAMALQVDLLEQAVRIEKSDQYPNFYLTGNYQMTGSSNEWNSFTDQERSASSAAGIYVTFPFWTSGATGARIRQTKSDLRIAEIRLRQTEERILREVIGAEFDIEAAEKQVEATTKSLEQAERAYGIAETRYEHGLLTQIELFDARLAQTRTSVLRLQALHGALTARAAWIRTVGIPWGEEW